MNDVHPAPWLLALLVVAASMTSGGAIEVVDPRCEYRTDPLGVDCLQPRLSWRLASSSTARGQVQTAYRILVASTVEGLAADHGDVWDSGRVPSAETRLIPCAAEKLHPARSYWWKVQAWDGQQAPSPWSPVGHWTMGLLAREDWKGAWIGLGGSDGWDHLWFRKRFALSAAPVRAIAYIGSMGYHELSINGQPVGHEVLAPNVSYLPKRTLYATYDVTALLRAGDNAVGLWLGPGWINFPMSGKPLPPGVNGPLAIAQIHIDLADGSQVIVASDGTWKSRISCSRHIGKATYADTGGDRFTAAEYVQGWDTVSLDDSAWASASVQPLDVILSADIAEPNRVVERLHPVKITATDGGGYTIDMGRHFTGWLELTLTGTPGQTIRVMVSDDPKRRNEASYNQISEYIPDATGKGTFRHRFNHVAGRWVTVQGLSVAPQTTDIHGLVIANDRRKAGGFACSNDLFNQIHAVTDRTYQALSLGGMSVDCPHRERRGYGGDAHTTLDFALLNWESGAFFTKWIQDWRDVQRGDGSVPNTAPTFGGAGGPGWSGFLVVMPWEAYLAYGDRRILEETYPAMKAWLEFLATKQSEDGLIAWWEKDRKRSFIGDWNAPGREGVRSETDADPGARLFNNCYVAHALDIAGRIAQTLGRPGESLAHRQRGEAIRTAIHRVFSIAGEDIYVDDQQSHLLMPLVARAVPSDRVDAVRQRLFKAIIEDKKGHLDTGMHGTYFLGRYLTEQRRGDLMAVMLGQTTYPGYGHLLKRKRVTTWPEAWNGDGTQIHHTLPGMTAWFQQGLAGIRFDERYAGTGRVLIAPQFVEGVDHAGAHWDGPQGRFASAWSRADGRVALRVEVPVNGKATVEIPVGDPGAIREGGRPLVEAEGVAGIAVSEGRVEFTAGSGIYEIVFAPDHAIQR